MNDLQPLLTGYLVGTLLRAKDVLLIDVKMLRDEAGNYRPEIEVVGKQSGTKLVIRVELIRDE